MADPKILGNKPVHAHAVVQEMTAPVQHPGITLREHFAGLALQGIAWDPEQVDPAQQADVAVRLADALIARLAQEGAA